MAGDDFFQGVKQQILSLWVGLDLREDELEVLEIAGTHTSCVCVCVRVRVRVSVCVCAYVCVYNAYVCIYMCV